MHPPAAAVRAARTRPRSKPPPDTLADALRAAADRTDDVLVKEWLRALLERGERAEAPPTTDKPASAAS
jgi:hypothetical protein